MASIIRIKRSSVSGNPSTLAAGELAYSALADNGSNGGDRLYIGMGTETAGNAANHIIVGGKYYTTLVDNGGAGGTLTTNAKSVPVLSATGTIDKWLVGNLQLTGNTLSSTNTNGDINITPNGTGKLILTNTYIGDSATSLSEYIYDTVGGAVTAGNGITITNSDGGNTSTVSIDTTVTVDKNTAQTLTNKTINLGSNTLVATSAQLAAALTDETGTGYVVFSASPALTGTVTANSGGASTAISVTTASSTNSILVTDTGASGANIKLAGNGGTTASKTIRSYNGNFEIVNDAYTAAVFRIGDTGNATVMGTLGVTGATTLSSTLGVTGAATLSSTLGVTGATTLSSTLAVTGQATFNSIVDMTGHKITNLAEPTADSDAATKYYVDAARSGLDIKSSVKAATTANITLSNTQTIDGVALSVGDRILVKDQTTASQNGIYVVASGAWSRAADADAPAELNPGTFVFVEQGTVNDNTGFVVVSDSVVTIGTDDINWTLFSASGTLIAGNGLSKNGYTLEVNVANGIEISSDNVQLASTVAGAGLTYTSGVLDVVGTANRITANANSIDIASTYVGQTSLTTLGTITTGTWNGSVIADAYISDTLTLTGGSIDGTPIGATTRSTGAFTTLAANGATSLTSTLAVSGNVTLSANLTGAGAGTSTIDGFTIDGGTY